MRAVIQRVNYCEVIIEDIDTRRIAQGLLVLIGIGMEDTTDDVNWIVQKVIGMRIFGDQNNKMNLSVMDIKGEIMVVSQFTLLASTKKGNRPSFIRSAKPEQAIPLYNEIIEKLSLALGYQVKTGVFGAMMKLDFENDGPVTILLDSKNKE